MRKIEQGYEDDLRNGGFLTRSTLPGYSSVAQTDGLALYNDIRELAGQERSQAPLRTSEYKPVSPTGVSTRGASFLPAEGGVTWHSLPRGAVVEKMDRWDCQH